MPAFRLSAIALRCKIDDISEPMSFESHFGEEEKQLLERFRRFARAHVDDFKAARDRVRELLAPKQPYLTGIAREDLLRQFLRRLLPHGVSVDSGVIYGFEKKLNSNQIDVLIWDSMHYPPVHRGEAFVVLPPEAVIAAISVKTAASRSDFVDSVGNLMSIVDLDLGFRTPVNLPPITKIAFFYDPPSSPVAAQQWITDALRHETLQRTPLHEVLRETLEKIDPIKPAQDHIWYVERIYPRLFVHLEGELPVSYARGWGPPDLTAEEALKQRYHRRPYVYQQRGNITTPLEKLAYHVLTEVFHALGTKGSSIASAWGDFHPQYHFRVGDAAELCEDSGTAILNDTDL